MYPFIICCIFREHLQLVDRWQLRLILILIRHFDDGIFITYTFINIMYTLQLYRQTRMSVLDKSFSPNAF